MRSEEQNENIEIGIDKKSIFFTMSSKSRLVFGKKKKFIKFHIICIRGVCAKLLQSCSTLCNPMDCSPPAPLSMGFSRQEDWSGLPCSLPGYLLNPGIEPTSLVIYCIGRQDLYP